MSATVNPTASTAATSTDCCAGCASTPGIPRPSSNASKSKSIVLVVFSVRRIDCRLPVAWICTSVDADPIITAPCGTAGTQHMSYSIHNQRIVIRAHHGLHGGEQVIQRCGNSCRCLRGGRCHRPYLDGINYGGHTVSLFS